MFHIVYIVCLRNCDICWCYFTRSGIFFIADLLEIDSVVEINKKNTIVLFIIPPARRESGVYRDPHVRPFITLLVSG